MSRFAAQMLARIAMIPLAALAACPPSAFGQSKVLDLNSDTLTTFNMDNYSYVQACRPLVGQRGVNIDGALRHSGVQGLTLWANPFGESWDSQQKLSDIRVDLGTYSPTEIDLALPCIGPAWVVGRSFNSVERNAANSGYWNSTGYQGSNWFQMSQPELVFGTGVTDDKDTLYLVYGADRYIEFQRTGSGSDYFKARNGAAGVIKHDPYTGSTTPTPPGTYTYYDQVGNQAVFFDADYNDGTHDYFTTGQVWKIVDANSQLAYVGDPSSIVSAATAGFDQDTGRIKVAYDSAARRFSYTYSLTGVSGKLTSVVAEIKSGGSWASPGTVTEVGRVEYTYYGATVTDQGLTDDLKLVTITTPLSPSSTNLVRKQYYRYYTSGTYNSSTNPGSPHQIKMVLGYEGTRNYDWQDATFNNSYDSTGVSDTALKPYSSIYLEYYDTSTGSENGKKRIKKVQFNGECGCSGGGGDGKYEFEYDVNSGFSNSSGYDTAWKSRVQLKRPDTTYELRYFDEVGQPLSKVVTDLAPGTPPTKSWANYVVRDSNGCVTDIATPQGSVYTDTPSKAITEAGSIGLVNVIERVDSTLGAFTGLGDLDGLPAGSLHREAGSGTKYYISSITPTSFSVTLSGSIKVVRPLVASSSVYPTATTTRGSGVNTTGTSNTAHSSTVALKQVDTTLPTVSTGNNGSGSANSRKDYLGLDGRPQFTKNEEGVIGYRGYDSVTGLLATSIQDADTQMSGGSPTNADFSGVTIPTDFQTSVTTTLHYKTTYTYDAQGRLDTSTSPDGRVSKMYYTRLKDGRSVTLSIPKITTGGGTTTCYGPVGYTISNHAGRVEAQGTIALSGNTSTTALGSWILNGSSDPTNPIGALNVGSVARLTYNLYDNAGVKTLESRLYFAMPSSANWGNSTYDNPDLTYDSTIFGYDEMGRRWRTKSPAGDITRLRYDELGRTTQRWVGTNDNDSMAFPGGESSGTENMTEVETLVYDGGSSGGNSQLTSRNLDPDGDWTGGNSDLRTTTYQYDYRSRLIFTAPPIAPFTVALYDNLGRTIAVGQYDASGGLGPTTDPTSTATAASGATKRIALSETAFDEMGRAWKTTRHKITQTTGADADSIDTFNWFDPVGRQIKVNGETLAKTRYDRLGRVTHQFALSKDDDLTGSVFDYGKVYASGTTDVGGDTVVEENQTVYDNSNKTGLVLMRVGISRHWNESSSTYGALDSNADGVATTVTAANVKGRVQITSMWYDDLNRPTDTVNLGTNAIIGDGSNTTGTYTRGSTTTSGQPSRSSTALRTSYSYADDGTVLDVTGPRVASAEVTRTLYDNAGRRITTIASWTGASPPLSTADRDTDLYTRFTYVHGLQTEMFVDLDGDGTKDSDDQVTKYLYGTTKSASNSPSQVASGGLLRATIYPDSTNIATTASYVDGTSDAQVTSYAYNAQGQKLSQKDPAGNVIAYTYDKLGRETARTASVVSPFDSNVLEIDTAYLARGLVDTITQVGASAAVRDQVQYSYDDWGNLTKFEQDPDSVIGGSGRAAYSVQYSYAKAGSTTTRNTLRRSGTTMPRGNSLTYTYSSGMDADLSRVSAINNGVVDLAQYGYLGRGTVAYTILPQPQAWNSLMESGVSYPYWDRFNRPVTSQWEKTYANPAAKFYNVGIAYDEDSNITSVTDAVHKTDIPPNSGIASFDALYSMDLLNRLTEVQEGNKSGSSIGTQSRGEQWKTSAPALALGQTGNWETYRLATSGTSYSTFNSDFDTANKYKASGSGFNGATDSTYDLNGNLTSEGSALDSYQYVYDAFNRLRQIKDKTGNVVQEYRYNGLGYRIGWHYDVSKSGGGGTDGTVDSNDPWYYFAYDERWRVAATYRGSDTYPKEQFYAHGAGLGGYGGSSYIDAVIMRDRDANTSWADTAADGTLEERVYYCQNWRADVSAVLDSSGAMLEWVKYSAYGVPLAIPAGDTTGDGVVDSTDDANAVALDMYSFGNANYDVRADWDLDGTIDTTDEAYINGLIGTNLGRTKLSRTDVAGRRGYAGYESSGGGINSTWQVRNRVLSSAAGRWLQRDPAGYSSDLSLISYCADRAMVNADAFGLMAVAVRGKKPCLYCKTYVWFAVSGPAIDQAAGNAVLRAAAPGPLVSGGTTTAPYGPTYTACQNWCQLVYPGGGDDYGYCLQGCAVDELHPSWPCQNMCQPHRGTVNYDPCIEGCRRRYRGTQDPLACQVAQLSCDTTCSNNYSSCLGMPTVISGGVVVGGAGAALLCESAVATPVGAVCALVGTLYAVINAELCSTEKDQCFDYCKCMARQCVGDANSCTYIPSGPAPPFPLMPGPGTSPPRRTIPAIPYQ